MPHKRVKILKPAPVYKHLVVIWSEVIVQPVLQEIVSSVRPEFLCHKAWEVNNVLKTINFSLRPHALIIYTANIDEDAGRQVIQTFLGQVAGCKVLLYQAHRADWDIAKIQARYPGRLVAFHDGQGATPVGQENEGITRLRAALADL